MFVKKFVHHNYIKWRIQRPERMNSLGVSIGQELWDMIVKLREECKKNQNIRALVIDAEPVSTNSGKVWIAGGDLKELAKLTNQKDGYDYAQLYQNICAELELLPIPVIFLINGKAIGGGVELALAGDMRIATRETEFVFKQTLIGLATGYGGASRLNELVGRAKASSWLFQGRAISGDEALASGLVCNLVEESYLETLEKEIIAEIVKSPWRAIKTQKQMLHLRHRGQLADELELFGELWMNPDHEKFLARFND